MARGYADFVFPARAGMNRRAPDHARLPRSGVPRPCGDEPVSVVRGGKLRSWIVFPACAGMNRCKFADAMRGYAQVFPACAEMNRPLGGSSAGHMPKCSPPPVRR